MVTRNLCRVGFASALVLGLCLATSAQSGDKDKKELVITEKQNKETVKVPKGTVVVIKLDGLPSAGYTWEVAKNNAEVLTYAGKPEIEKEKTPVIGAKQTFLLRFTPKIVGSSEIELNYRRPFEKDVPPAKTFKVKIDVTE